MAYPQAKGQTDKVENLGKIIYGGDGTNFYPISVNSSGVLTGTIPSKTVQTELYSASTIAASAVVISSVLSLATVKKATFFIDHGRAASAAWTTNGTEYRVEVSQQASGNDTWRPIASVLAGSAVANSVAASTSCVAAVTTVAIISTTAAIAPEIYCFTNPAGSIEWVRSIAVSGTANFTILDPTLYSHVSATGIFAQGEHFVLSINTESVTRARVVINNLASAGTNPIAARVAVITEQ